MTEYVQEPLFYTEEEFNTKVAHATIEIINRNTAENEHTVQRAKNNLNHRISEQLFEELKEQLSASTISQETAEMIYGNMASSFGWSAVNFNTKTWTVTVSLYGDEIGEVEGIEAEDSEDACQQVQDSFDLYNVDATAEFRDGNGDRHTLELSGIEHDLNDYFMSNLEFSADEEE